MGHIEINSDFEKDKQIDCIEKILENVKNDLWNLKSFQIQYSPLCDIDISMEIEINREKIIKS